MQTASKYLQLKQAINCITSSVWHSPDSVGSLWWMVACQTCIKGRNRLDWVASVSPPPSALSMVWCAELTVDDKTDCWDNLETVKKTFLAYFTSILMILVKSRSIKYLWWTLDQSEVSYTPLPPCFGKADPIWVWDSEYLRVLPEQNQGLIMKAKLLTAATTRATDTCPLLGCTWEMGELYSCRHSIN